MLIIARTVHELLFFLLKINIFQDLDKSRFADKLERIRELEPVMPGLRAQKKQETRQAICEAAVKLFTGKGYETTSIEDIAQSAGIGKTTVYGYFANKEEIFLNYCDEQLEEAFSQFQKDGLEGRPLLEKLVRFFMLKLIFVTRNPEFGRQMMREMLFPRYINEQTQHHDQRYFAVLDNIFTEAQEQGLIAPEHDRFFLTVHFFSLYLGVVTGWYKGYVTSLDKAEEAMRIVFKQALEGVYL